MKYISITLLILACGLGAEAQTKEMEQILSAYKGSVVYVDFWATWCGPCIAELGNHEQWLQQHYAGKKVKFVFISMDQPKDTAAARSDIDTRRLRGTLLFWGIGEMKDVYFKAPGFLPTYMLFDKNGQLVNDNAKRPSETPGIYLQIDSLLNH
jgi:thiol-disulfide isomerase/thioredoxin